MTTFHRLSVRFALSAIGLVMVAGFPLALDGERATPGPAIAAGHATPTPGPTPGPNDVCIDTVCG